ncbi:hypothetical protein RhiirA5_413018 [Rhizophagus irregularis]|uniref:Uncharacterized protein n=1 Tax=Rhizophagus irregularis TaxID=588596 RepID=A0A2N0PXL9_9GLOM|nr:hypothetical protein RhiirA5_413018 [Rhizophagus irregularis]
MEGGIKPRDERAKKDLEETLLKAAEKRDGTKWAFRSFREVRDQPEELVEIVDNLRRDNQPRDPKKKDKDKKEQCIECLALKYVVTEKDVITHHLVINELAGKNVILRFIPYNSNRVPSKAEVKDFDTNNEKMKARLAKEDKTKIVEVL